LRTFEDFVEDSRQAGTLEELKDTLARLFADEGYQNFGLIGLIGRDKVGELLLSNIPPSITEVYRSERWERADPLLPIALRTTRPVVWEHVWQGGDLSKEQVEVVEGFKHLGMCKGITFPLYDIGGPRHVVGLSRCDYDDDDTDRFPLLQAFCTQAWSRFLELAGDFSTSTDILSTREIEILNWMKEGKSNWDIAEILNLSIKTVEYHVSNVLKKLGAPNRITAVVTALRHGIIQL
jgi:DNA-binding CsgD family transcriptional regulator